MRSRIIGIALYLFQDSVSPSQSLASKYLAAVNSGRNNSGGKIKLTNSGCSVTVPSVKQTQKLLLIKTGGLIGNVVVIIVYCILIVFSVQMTISVRTARLRNSHKEKFQQRLKKRGVRNVGNNI